MHGEINILFYLMIYLTAMVLVVPIAKRLGLGVVLGYLLAGLALEATAFDWLKTQKALAHWLSWAWC